jgi:hypothetical protein
MFCYKLCLFGLKNIGATYQLMVNKVFKHQLRRIIERCTDGMSMNNMTFEKHLLSPFVPHFTLSYHALCKG